MLSHLKSESLSDRVVADIFRIMSVIFLLRVVICTGVGAGDAPASKNLTPLLIGLVGWFEFEWARRLTGWVSDSAGSCWPRNA